MVAKRCVAIAQKSRSARCAKRSMPQTSCKVLQTASFTFVANAKGMAMGRAPWRPTRASTFRLQAALGGLTKIDLQRMLAGITKKVSPVQGHEKVVALSTVVFPIHLHERTKFGHGCFELGFVCEHFWPSVWLYLFPHRYVLPKSPSGCWENAKNPCDCCSVAVFMLWPLRLLCLRYIPDSVFPSLSRYTQP